MVRELGSNKKLCLRNLPLFSKNQKRIMIIQSILKLYTHRILTLASRFFATRQLFLDVCHRYRVFNVYDCDIMQIWLQIATSVGKIDLLLVFISKTKNHTCIQSCTLFVWFDWTCRVLPVRLSSHQLSNENGHCQLSNHSSCQPCCRDEGIHSATWFCHLAQNSGIRGLNITRFWCYFIRSWISLCCKIWKIVTILCLI